jgi:dipeptidase E
VDRAAVVTTADPELKERNRNAVLARDTLLALGVPVVEFFDFDAQPSAGLAAFGLVYLAGGNPFYLLQRVRETGAESVLRAMLAAGRPFIGSSAGALLLGRSLNIVPVFDSAFSDQNDINADALGLLPFTVLPHANRWKSRFADYSDRLAAARVLCRSVILEIANDEGLLLVGDTVSRIGSTVPSTPVALSAPPFV